MKPQTFTEAIASALNEDAAARLLSMQAHMQRSAPVIAALAEISDGERFARAMQRLEEFFVLVNLAVCIPANFRDPNEPKIQVP